jgi:alpha-N-arabinofuranosidase
MNMAHTRRGFLRTTAAGIACATALRSADSDSSIEVLLNEPIAAIAPEIYGHFTEHLGGVVYDGIWVGEGSAIPNVGGIRKQLVDALRRIHPPVIRWPGGCFADSYDWHDGIGPRAKRPKRSNFWVDAMEWPKGANPTGPQHFEPNQFGTIEFARFCKLTGAQPYFAANLRGLAAQDFGRWVEYCNSPAGTTTLAEQRAADGEPDPLNVRFWGVGNEAWGCGGTFLPEDYATEFLRFTAWVPEYGKHLSFVGSGPNDNDLDWTRRFLTKVAQKDSLNRLWGWAMHHYSWNVSGGRSHGEVDAAHRVKLVVDEWGSWHMPGTEPFADAVLGQQNTMRDAVLAGLTLDTFNRHADKVGMAAVAQLVNCLQSLFLAHEDRFCLTPTYHVFDMYAAHQGAQSLRTMNTTPSISWAGNDRTLPGLYCSSSLREKRLTLTVTNPHLDQTRETDIRVRGAGLGSATAVTLAAPDVHAHNTFQEPRVVEPRSERIDVRGSGFTHRFPPASVSKLEISLG